MASVLVIGAGVSGLSIASILKESGHAVLVAERSSSIGGLVKCTEHEGVLFHRVGGHVFNSKNPRVTEWFWSKFDQDLEFVKSRRNAKIYINGNEFAYPIENNITKFPLDVVKSIVDDLLSLNFNSEKSSNFKDFLLNKFGKTLCDIYFYPYNEKLWRRPLDTIPLEWLDGKLPMPKVNDIFVSNLCDLLETEMVHSFFYYAKSGGSQFIVDRLSLGLDISLNSKIQAIELKPEGVLVDGIFYDKVIYTGDVRDLGDLLVGLTPDIDKLLCQTKKFPSNSTTNVLCESLEPIDFSWLYFPESKYSFHRVINTGSFSVNNSPVGMVGSCVVEFSGVFEEAFVLQELEKLPFKVRPIATNIEQASYVIHDNFVSEVVGELKCALEANNFHLLGRFAEWQYYNMDKAMEAAFELAGKFPHASN